MDTTSNNQIRMLRMVKNILSEKSDHWSEFAPFSACFDKFLIELASIEQNEETLAGIEPVGSAKKKLHEQYMVEIAIKICASTYVYADDKGDTDLMRKMDLSKTDFSSYKETEKVSKAQMIFNTVKPMVDALADYKITEDDIDLFHTRIENYISVVNAPKLNINVASEARAEIKRRIKKALVLLLKMDKLMLHFVETEKEFYDLYFKARLVIDYGHRYRKAIAQISGTTFDFETEVPVAFCKVYLAGDEKHRVVSDAHGLFSLGAYAEGEQLLMGEKEGYMKSEEVIEIVKDEDLEMNIELEAVQVSGEGLVMDAVEK